MKIVTQIKKRGDSTYVLVPGMIMKYLDLNENDMVNVTFEKITSVTINEGLEICSYKCNSCAYSFDTDIDNVYCPICGENNGNIIKVEVNE
jgi:rubrerythrin